MAHNFPGSVLINKALTLAEAKELLKLAIDAEIPIYHEVFKTLVDEKYPYYCYNDGNITQTSTHPTDSSKYFVVTLDEFKQFMIGKGKLPYREKVTLNDSYEAIVTKTNITVGCQTFTHDAIAKLYKISQKALKS